jgi:hypothetical protein
MTRESRTVDRSHQVDSPTPRHQPLVDLLVDTRAELMELAVNSGLQVLTTMLEEDRTAFCGPGISTSRTERRLARARCRARSFWVAERWRCVGRGSAATAPNSRCRRFS